MPETHPVQLDQINIYGGTQTRAATNDEAVSAYAESMEAGNIFPPITLYFDGTQYWLADGFHRFLATKRLNQATIEATVHEGGRSDALLHALGANATNGLFRNNADKRNSVEIAFEEWPDHSNSYIAEICNVSADLVAKVRKENAKYQRDSVTGKDGKTYKVGIERSPRAGSSGKEKSDGDSGKDSGQGGGGGGKPSKKNMNLPDRPGGSYNELEGEARKMIRDGELDPRDLSTIGSATAIDYAYAVINLLERIDPADKKFHEGLNIIEQWIRKQRNPQAALAAEIDDENDLSDSDEAFADLSDTESEEPAEDFSDDAEEDN